MQRYTTLSRLELLASVAVSRLATTRRKRVRMSRISNRLVVASIFSKVDTSAAYGTLDSQLYAHDLTHASPSFHPLSATGGAL